MIVMREIFQTFDDHSLNNENLSLKEGEKYSTIIQRDDTHGGQFGFSIAGGENQTVTSPTNGNDNFYISKINNQEKPNSLEIGDRLLSINGHDTSNINHDQAIDMINNGGNNIELVLYREKTTNGNEKSTTIDHTTEVCLKNKSF
jgi:C-terminal processing protease CtpA/Prc